MAWSIQIYFVANNFTEVTITPLWVTLNLTVATVTAFALQAKNFLGQRMAVLLIIFYMPLTYIFLGTLPGFFLATGKSPSNSSVVSFIKLKDLFSDSI